MTLIVLGLDGFHRDLLTFTPFIRRQFNSASSGPLESTTPPVTAPAWASFQTGMNQGRHGVFDFVDYDEGLNVTLLDGRSLRAKSIYEYLDEEGYDCYLQNLPFALPPRIDGDVMPSWLDGDKASPQPRDLCEQYDIEQPNYPDLDGTPVENIREMEMCFNNNARIFRNVLEQAHHDFYFHLISVTDWLQHQMYEGLASGEQTKETEKGRSLLSEVDEYVKEIIEQSGDETDILLVSDHGFRLFNGAFFINDWLARERFLVQSHDGHRFTTKDEQDTTVVETGSIGQWLRRRSVWSLFRPVKDVGERLLGVDFTVESGIDLERSLAYCRSKDEAAIRFNESHPDYDCEIISIVMNKLEDVDCVTAHRASELYDGPHTSIAGEIVLTGKTHVVQRGPIGTVRSDFSTAHHCREGIVIGLGPSFNGDPVQPKLIDIAPTIAFLCDLPVPAEMDGQVMDEAMESDRPIKYTVWESYEPTFLTREMDSAGVETRLENLGYL